MRVKKKRELYNKLVLFLIINSIFLTGATFGAMVAAQDHSNDLTESDAQSDLIAFIPYADSGLQTTSILKYPQKEMIVPYDSSSNVYDSSARVNFKIGEWKYLGENNESREEFKIDNDTTLIRSEFWFETDVITWTDLEYDDVFHNGASPIEVQDQLQWLFLKKRHNYGYSLVSLNDIFRISAWNDDLYNIYKKVGAHPSDKQLDPYVNFILPQGKPYWYKFGLQQLLANPINYMPQHYNKYLKWYHLNFPGNPTNMRDYSLNRFNDLKISGDLFIDVNMQESFWNALKFPNIIEVKDNETGDAIGQYNNTQVLFSIDNAYLIGPNDPNHPESRTRIVDLQELYDNMSNTSYDPNSAEGNMVSSTTDNQPQETSDMLSSVQDFSDPSKVHDLVPDDVIGDGSIITGIVDRTADYSWNLHQVERGPQATLPGTAALEPMIWENDETPSTITHTDLLNLKPLDQITLQDVMYGQNIKDRDSAVFKVRFEFGPKLIIKYATMDFQEIHLTIENGFLGGDNYFFSITDISDLTHVPYSANVRNIGLCQTVKLKVMALSTYDYTPYDSSSGDDISPDFPIDDTHIEGPEEPETGGDTHFTTWTDQFDPLDALIGAIMDFLGEFWWVVLILIVALVAVGAMVLKFVIGGPMKGAKKYLDMLMSLGMDVSKLGDSLKQVGGSVHHLELTHKSKTSTIIFGSIIVVEVAVALVVFMQLI